MKRMLCTVLCAAMLLCGCQSAPAANEQTRGATEALTEEVTENVTETHDVTATAPQTAATEPQSPTQPFVEQVTVPGNTAGESGRIRVEYKGNVSSVRYITSVDQLPAYEEFAAYDEAYFETGALVVVLESVSSGSVQVGIASIEKGVVTLSHERSGDVGTTDMATWLLWTEVEQGLDCEWSVANPALKSNTSAY